RPRHAARVGPASPASTRTTPTGLTPGPAISNSTTRIGTASGMVGTMLPAMAMGVPPSRRRPPASIPHADLKRAGGGGTPATARPDRRELADDAGSGLSHRRDGSDGFGQDLRGALAVRGPGPSAARQRPRHARALRHVGRREAAGAGRGRSDERRGGEAGGDEA